MCCERAKIAFAHAVCYKILDWTSLVQLPKGINEQRVIGRMGVVAIAVCSNTDGIDNRIGTAQSVQTTLMVGLNLSAGSDTVPILIFGRFNIHRTA